MYILHICIYLTYTYEAVLKRLEQAVLLGQRVVISAITYLEMRFGAIGPKQSPRHFQLADGV